MCAQVNTLQTPAGIEDFLEEVMVQHLGRRRECIVLRKWEMSYIPLIRPVQMRERWNIYTAQGKRRVGKICLDS